MNPTEALGDYRYCGDASCVHRESVYGLHDEQPADIDSPQTVSGTR